MNDKVDIFAQFHVPGDPLILYNIWDAGSAAAVAKAGAKAIATGSWGVAGAHGFGDGEKFPIELALSNLSEVLSVTDLPVTIDLEAGYGATPALVGQSVERVARLGAAGINIEDKDPATRVLFDTAEAAARIRAAAATGLFINARADMFILTPLAEHDAALVDRVAERARAYADAGAGGLFTPFLTDEALIARMCDVSPLPVNILIHSEGPSHARLAELGVARISHGHGPWAAAMDWLTEEAKNIFQNSL
jgi:2-methylisocitrate lyase-like PEP mutase family enzyme